MKKKALILTWEKFQDHEVIYPYYSLKENGFEVNLVANKLGRVPGILGAHMPCDTLTTEFESSKNREKFLNDYDLLMIPGGVKALEKLRLQKGIVEFVKAPFNMVIDVINFVLGKISGFTRGSNPISIGVTGNTVGITTGVGISTFPTIKRTGGDKTFDQTGSILEKPLSQN